MMIAMAKTFFNASGHVCARVWLRHDKEPELLHQDLVWWMKNEQRGLCCRSLQAGNISGVGWLLCFAKEINCAALQAANKKQTGNKCEDGWRFKMISLGHRGAFPRENQIKAIHIECNTAAHFDVKVALSKIHASAKNDDCLNGIRLQLVPEINSVISPETCRNVSHLRVRQDNFQKQMERCASWDIDALDFVDPSLGRLLRDLIMKIESCTVVGQPLFHTDNQTWDQNGHQFSFCPNVDTEAGSMIMSLVPFLQHHCQEFLATAQRRALGAAWDLDKGWVKTLDNTAVSWMTTEEGQTSLNAPHVTTQEAAACPDPSDLQVGAGLIEDQDSVGTFDPQQGAAAVDCTGAPAQLVTGSKANPLPRVLPARTGLPSNSVDGRSARSSMTQSTVSCTLTGQGRQARATIAPDCKMDLILTTDAALVPPTPHRASPDPQLPPSLSLTASLNQRR